MHNVLRRRRRKKTEEEEDEGEKGERDREGAIQLVVVDRAPVDVAAAAPTGPASWACGLCRCTRPHA